MKWKNAVRDGLPGYTVDLLISYKGVYHTARFLEEKRTFVITGESGAVELPGDAELLYWIIPEEKKERRNSLKILIADDDAEDHTLIREALAAIKVRCEVDSVYDGEQAIDYLLRRNVYKNIDTLPDILLLDLNMPRIDGFGVLKEIKTHPQLRELPVFMITTSHDAAHLGNALELGARGFYTKGSTREEMSRVIRNVCAECFDGV